MPRANRDDMLIVVPKATPTRMFSKTLAVSSRFSAERAEVRWVFLFLLGFKIGRRTVLAAAAGAVVGVTTGAGTMALDSADLSAIFCGCSFSGMDACAASAGLATSPPAALVAGLVGAAGCPAGSVDGFAGVKGAAG